MKKYLAVLILFVLVLSACNTPNGLATKTYEDDIYYSSKDAAADKEKARITAELAKQEADRKAAEQAKADEDYYNSKKQVTVVEEEPFDPDDYYDYEYATRLRRFHNNCGSYGYYDNYYTNSYWYTGNPYNYGTSVYMGYSWWGPTYMTYNYNPSFYWYSSYGWGYDPWYNPYGYNPYWGYDPYGYYGYNPYWNGYNNGYWAGYYNGYNNGYFNNYYFNSYDNNSYYYGPRKTTGSNTRATSQPSLASRYMNAVEKETAKPFEETKGRNDNPYALQTTVNDYMSKPQAVKETPNPGYRPVNPNYTPANSDAKERPQSNTSKDDYYSKPDTYTKPDQNTKDQKPVYQNNYDKPRNDDNQSKPQKPQYDQPKYDQPKPRVEQPKFESPNYNNSSSPAPRSGGSNNSSSPQPRRR